MTVHFKLFRLHDLWQAKRDGRLMPGRADFDPFVLREWLGNLILIDALSGGREFRVRLHGSHLAWSCGDATGKSAALLLVDERAAVTADCARVVAERVPLFARYHQTIAGQATDFAAIILPLSNDDANVTMLMMAAYAHDAS